MVWNFTGEGVLTVLFETYPKFSGLLTHDNSISRWVIENLVDSEMLFSKHFLAVSGAVRIYQRTSDPSLLQSRIDIVESVILIILNSKYSQPMKYL